MAPLVSRRRPPCCLPPLPKTHHHTHHNSPCPAPASPIAMPSTPPEALPPCPPKSIRLRVYHEYERPRNGRELHLPLRGGTAAPTATASALHAVLSASIDATRFTPHIYHPSADCFVPVLPDSDRVFAAEPAAEGALLALPHLDVKLVRASDAGRGAGGLAQQLVCDSSATALTGSWFGIGIVRGKTASNHGSLWRSALQFGAAMTFTIGRRYEKKVEGSADIYKTYRQVPCVAYPDVSAFVEAAAVDAQVVVIEYGGEDLSQFKHPKRAVYVLGSEDAGVPPALVQHAQAHVAIPTAPGRPSSLNVAAAGAVVMYDRQMKMARAKRERDEANGAQPSTKQNKTDA